MTSPTEVPANNPAMDLTALFAKKGELVTQIELATNMLNGPNGVNQQIQAILNTQPGIIGKPEKA